MKRFSETGNVLFLILIAVILFGALSFTVAQMMRGGNAEYIGEQQLSLYADEVLDVDEERIIRRSAEMLGIKPSIVLKTKKEFKS